MQAFLILQRSSRPAQQIRLAAVTVVGRSHDCNLRIASSEVSRRHCRIEVTANGVTIRDLGSSNGTAVDGVAIPPHVDVSVQPGSQLSIGPMRFVVEFEAPRTRNPKPDETTRILTLPELGQPTSGESVDFILSPANPESPPPDPTATTCNRTVTDEEVDDQDGDDQDGDDDQPDGSSKSRGSRGK
jgi:predicted component of type VI protein secretion system